MSKEVNSSVVVVCGPSTGGTPTRVDEICSLNARRVVAAEDTIFALTPGGVYDVFSLSLAVNSQAAAMAGGLTHNVLLSSDGDLYAWGAGPLGELGLGPRDVDMETPGQVRCAAKVTSLSCGDSHSCVVDSFGNAYAWGQNFSRQLGLYTKNKSDMPANCVIEELVMTPRVLPFSVKHSVAKVACGAEFSMAVTKSGVLYTWGAGECGQLGTGRCKMKEVPSECVVMVKGKGNDGNGNDGNGNGSTKAKIKDIACGYGHSGALTEDGDVVMWGLNKHGQLGTCDNLTVHEPLSLPVAFKGTSLYAKDNSTACIAEGGALYTWGAGGHFRLMHGDCSTVHAPKKVEALGHEMVSEFVFAPTASAVLVRTQLFTISPTIGMLKSFKSLELSGCGFWSSTSIVVKFSKCPDSSDGLDDMDNPAALIPPRSCMGQLSGQGTITCKPPRLTHTGYYDVSMAMDGKHFLSGTQRVFVCSDPVVMTIENCLYDLRESETIDISMVCTGLDEVGPGIEVYVRLVNVDNPEQCTPPMLAELLPMDEFAELDPEESIGMDDQSGGGSIRSQASFEGGSFDEHDAMTKEEAAPAAGRRRILCRNVDLSALKNATGATLMLEAQLSRNHKDFAPGNDERIICHEFTPSHALPNCVPFSSQREITFHGSGFFPLGMQAAIAITTVIDAVPIEDGKSKKKGGGKKGAGPGPAVGRVSPSASRPLSPDPSMPVGVDGGNSLGEGNSVASLASVGSFMMESESPAFHAMTVPVRFDSISELAITVPGITDFLRPGLKLPDNMPAVLGAKILFCLASDATASLSKQEVDFYFYSEKAITVTPAICRRFSGQKFTIDGVENWLSFQPNAPKLIFSDKASGFCQCVDVETVSSDNGTYQIVCGLPGNDPRPEPAPAVEGGAAEGGEGEGEGEATAEAPAVITQSESFLERPEIEYKNIRIGLLLDGVSPPEEGLMCSVTVFDKVSILDLVAALPKEGAVKGATIAFNASGIVPSSTCVVRLRGVNDKYVDVDGTVGDTSEETGNGTFSFQMPENLGEIECHAKGKEKSLYVDISIDGGVSFDKSEVLNLVVGKY
jgi:hypothetical protein